MNSSHKRESTTRPTSKSKGHAYAWFFVSLLLTTANGCVDSSRVNQIAESLILPVQLTPDSTRIVLNDFHAWTGPIDSAIWEDGSIIHIQRNSEDGSDVIVLKKTPHHGIGHFELWSAGKRVDIPVLKSTKRSVTVKLEKSDGIQSASIMGSFTNWQASPIPMHPDGDSLSVTLNLNKGNHLYQFMANGKEFPDPTNSNQMANGFGGFNSVLSVGEHSDPASLTCSFEEALHCRAQPSSAYLVFYNNMLIDQGDIPDSGVFQVSLPNEAHNLNRSHIRIWTADEFNVEQNALIPIHKGSPIQDPALLTRHDQHSMVMYFLMVDRFKNGNTANDWRSNDPGVQNAANHQGGDLDGVRQSLAYLDSLGVNTVWISPIAPNPDDAWGFWSDDTTNLTSKFSGYHGYWPIRSTGIDHRFGTKAGFDSLVTDIHDQGMNILMDYVANHVHQDHPVYQQHPDWVTNLYLPDGSMNTQLWDSQRLTTWFDTFMPTLDLERPEVYETMTDSALWWVQNTGIDGFRHDATKHIPEVFWRRLTAKVNNHTTASGRKIFQIGETYGAPELIKKYVASGMIDAQFDFNLYDAQVAAFTADEPDLKALVQIAEQSISTYGAHHLMGNITGNQDRPRFTSLADGALAPGEDTKLAGWTREIRHVNQSGFTRMGWLISCLMSQAGIPCIYYGDEIADVGGNDPDNRRMMRFEGWSEHERNMWSLTHDWIQLRKTRMSMMYGQSRMYTPTEATGVLAIERTYLGEKTLTFINTTKEAKRIYLEPKTTTSLLVGQAEIIDNAVTIAPEKSAAFDIQIN